MVLKNSLAAPKLPLVPGVGWIPAAFAVAVTAVAAASVAAGAAAPPEVILLPSSPQGTLWRPQGR